MIPKIETDRLLLVAPDKSCFEAYEAFYTDSDASEAYGGPISRSMAWARLKSDVGGWYMDGFGVWAIKEKSSGKVVGVCGFWQGLGWPRELTWWLLPNSRGKGYAVEASLAVISYAYREFGWQEVETYMNDANKPAKSLVKRLGGVKSRRERFPDDLNRDIYVFPDIDI
ncbi:N-acetyltransferase [Vibrio sp. vnigr-6D03]|uniref:GNAT family N-acetyltransferase n=1 Tax=Vibrio sp. vnigr-6D03 TaxID=2058088 RepID=UPI000C325756|nr:GNAT family N-acetyltransferase [Vibrio sp. vnigr-6D03]PKF79569.1 N-acetyltransferase [Vibrio sp. vnigr-6D03]